MGLANDVFEELRKRGERLTVPRRLVIEALASTGGHLTMGHIERYLQDKDVLIDKSTVYRVLEWLNRLGLASQTDLGAPGQVFELIKPQPHHHLICLSCGEVLHIDDHYVSPLRQMLKDEFGFHPRIDHMAIFGYCRVCQAKRQEAS